MAKVELFRKVYCERDKKRRNSCRSSIFWQKVDWSFFAFVKKIFEKKQLQTMLLTKGAFDQNRFLIVFPGNVNKCMIIDLKFLIYLDVDANANFSIPFNFFYFHGRRRKISHFHGRGLKISHFRARIFCKNYLLNYLHSW